MSTREMESYYANRADEELVQDAFSSDDPLCREAGGRLEWALDWIEELEKELTP